MRWLKVRRYWNRAKVLFIYGCDARCVNDGVVSELVIAATLHDCINGLNESWKLTGYPVVVVGTTSESERVPKSILSSFKHEVSFEVCFFFLATSAPANSYAGAR
jgi:hypothetical protein